MLSFPSSSPLSHAYPDSCVWFCISCRPVYTIQYPPPPFAAACPRCWRAKAGSTSCTINNAAAVGGAPDSAAASDLLRKRATQGLVLGALVAAAIYAVYRSRRKPGRPRLQRSLGDDDKGRAATAAGGARWWQPRGVYGRWIKSDDEEEEEKEVGDGTKGGAGEGKSLERTRASSEGGSGGGGGEEHGRDEADIRVEGCEGAACPSTSSESADSARVAPPSPENARERADGVEDGEGRQSGTGVSDTGEGGEENRQGDKEAFETREGGDQDGGASGCSSEGDYEHLDEARAGGVPPKRSRTGSHASSQFFDPDCIGQSLRSESSTEELLAEADSLIADSKKASTTHRAAATTTTGTTRSASAPPGRPNNPFAIGKKTAGSSRTSGDARRRTHPRVYWEVTGEEVDALVSLTQRALKLDPAALSEIAEDASLQRSDEDDLLAGELAGAMSSIAALGEEEGAAITTKSADSTSFSLRDASSSGSGPESG